MSNLNEKRVKALLKGNAIVDKAIELKKAEKRDVACTIRAFHRSAKQLLEVKKLLSSPKFKNELKKAEIKGMTIKELVPIAVGMEYPTFARELQVAKVTLTQLNAFIKAVKEDESISVSKQGLLSFVKGKKQVKTETAKPTPKQANEGGKEETKEGGKESNVIAELIVKNVRVQIIDNEGVRSVKTDATPQQVKNALSTFKTMIEALPTKVLSK